MLRDSFGLLCTVRVHILRDNISVLTISSELFLMKLDLKCHAKCLGSNRQAQILKQCTI